MFDIAGYQFAAWGRDEGSLVFDLAKPATMLTVYGPVHVDQLWLLWRVSLTAITGGFASSSAAVTAGNLFIGGVPPDPTYGTPLAVGSSPAPGLVDAIPCVDLNDANNGSVVGTYVNTFREYQNPLPVQGGESLSILWTPPTTTCKLRSRIHYAILDAVPY